MTNEANPTPAIKGPVRYDSDTDRLVDADGDSIARIELTTPNGHIKDYPEWIADRKAQVQVIVDALNARSADREVEKRVERLKLALADAIRCPMGVVPERAEGLLTQEEMDAAEKRRIEGRRYR